MDKQLVVWKNPNRVTRYIMPYDAVNLFQPHEAQSRIDVYYRNLNILMMMKGMGGLCYSSEPNAPERPYGKWTRKVHFIFLKETRTEIREWLYIARLKLRHIPKDVVYLICGWIATK